MPGICPGRIQAFRAAAFLCYNHLWVANCDGWFLNCKALGYWDKELESDSLMAAIKESKGIIEKRMESIQKRIKEIYETPIEIARY